MATQARQSSPNEHGAQEPARLPKPDQRLAESSGEQRPMHCSKIPSVRLRPKSFLPWETIPCAQRSATTSARAIDQESSAASTSRFRKLYRSMYLFSTRSKFQLARPSAMQAMFPKSPAKACSLHVSTVTDPPKYHTQAKIPCLPRARSQSIARNAP